MARKSREELGISNADYNRYKQIRKARTALNKKIAQDYQASANLEYSHSLKALRKKEIDGKRFSIGDFRSRYDFEQFMTAGKRYYNYDEYIQIKARDYAYNMRQALKSQNATPEQIARFNKLLGMDDNDRIDTEIAKYLDEIYSENEELDISFVYVEVKEQGIERIDMTLDVLEELIKEKIGK